MNSADSDNLKKTEKICSICRTEIKAGEAHIYNIKVLCEDCCLNIRMTRVRKTHWQYLKSIKTEYLIPNQKGRGQSNG
jgi:hypothetical protein